MNVLERKSKMEWGHGLKKILLSTSNFEIGVA